MWQWQDREAIQDQLEQLKRDSFERITRSTVALLSARRLISRFDWYSLIPAERAPWREPLYEPSNLI
jgi:hypothetical protein